MLPSRDGESSALAPATPPARCSTQASGPSVFVAENGDGMAHENIAPVAATPTSAALPPLSAAAHSATKSRVLASRHRAATVSDTPLDDLPLAFSSAVPRFSVPTATANGTNNSAPSGNGSANGAATPNTAAALAKQAMTDELRDPAPPAAFDDPAVAFAEALRIAALPTITDWLEEARMIITVRRLAIHHPAVLQQQLKQFYRPLLRASVSERPELQIYTYFCFRDVFSQPVLAPALLQMPKLHAAAQILIATSARTGSKPLAAAAKEALHALCVVTKCKFLETFTRYVPKSLPSTTSFSLISLRFTHQYNFVIIAYPKLIRINPQSNVQNSYQFMIY